MGAFQIKCLAVIALLCVSALLIPSAYGDSIPILTISAPQPPLSGGLLFDGQNGPDFPIFAGFSFVLGRSFDNVSITAYLELGDNFTGTAWLTNGIGSGATPLNVIASAPFSRPGFCCNGSFVPTSFFGNLDLAPGTYDFFLSTHDSYGLWEFAQTQPTIVAAQGIGYLNSLYTISSSGCAGIGCPLNLDFPPASNWNASTFFYPTLEIDATPVPEPSSISTLLVGLAVVFLLTRFGKGPTEEAAGS